MKHKLFSKHYEKYPLLSVTLGYENILMSGVSFINLLLVKLREKVLVESIFHSQGT